MNEEQTRFRAAILTLPDRERAAFLLRRFDGMNWTGIGLALNCTTDEARQAFISAMTKLVEGGECEFTPYENERPRVNGSDV